MRRDKKEIVEHFLSKYGGKSSAKHRYAMEKVVDNLTEEQYRALKSKVASKKSLPELSVSTQKKDVVAEVEEPKEEVK